MEVHNIISGNVNKRIGMALLSLVTTALLSTNAMAALQKIGVVGAVNQNLSAIDENKNRRDLTIGADIYLNDTLSTDASGKAQLIFIDKSALTIGPSASVKIDKFIYNPADSAGELTMRGTKGAFRFIGGALSKKREVKFKTPVGTIGIRGNISTINVAPSGKIDLVLHYGISGYIQNAAGQISETNKFGYGISLASATAIPSVPTPVSVEAIAAQMQNFVSQAGETGGATIVPTEKSINKSGAIGDDKGGMDKKNDPSGQGGNGSMDKKNDPAGQGGKDGSKDGGKPGANNSNGQGGNNTANNTKKGIGGDGGRPTADGGYIDGEGNYHTPAEVAKHIAENPENANSGPNGGPNGGPNSANRGPAGTAARTGANSGAAAPGMAKDPGVLTADGGYMTPDGKMHSAADLAAFRREQANSTAGNNTAPAAANAAPGTYTAPAANTAYYGGSAGGYRAPITAVPVYNSAGPYAPAPYTAGPYTYNNTIYNSGGTTTYVAPTYIPPTNVAPTGTQFIFPPYAAGWLDTQYHNAISQGQSVFNTALNNGYSYADAQAQALAAFNVYIANYNGGGANNIVDYTALQTKENTSVNTNFGGASVFTNLRGTNTHKYVMGNETIPGSTATGVAKTMTVLERDTRRSNNNNCSTCLYVGWDAWGKVQSGQAAGITENATQISAVPYVYGQITDTANIPHNLNAYYNGTTSLSLSGMNSLIQSNFSANVSTDGSGYATLNSFGFNIPAVGANAADYVQSSGSTSFSGATFNGVSAYGSTYSATVNGALYGPSAQGIGGNINNISGGGVTGAGVYLGNR